MFIIPKKPRRINMNYKETKSDCFFKIDDVVSNIMTFVNVEDVLIPRTSKTLNNQFRNNKKKEKVGKKVKNLCMYTDTSYISLIYDEMSFYERNQFCIELIRKNNLHVFTWIRNRNDSNFLETYWRQKALGTAALLSGDLRTIEYINRNHIHVALSVNKQVLVQIIHKGDIKILKYLYELSVDFFSDEISSLLNEAILANNLEIVTFFIRTLKPIIVNITHVFSSIFVGNEEVFKILLQGHIGRRRERLFEHAAVYLKLNGCPKYNEFITDNNDIITNTIVQDCIFNKYDIKTIQINAAKLGNFDFLMDLKKRHSHLNRLTWFKTHVKLDTKYIDIDILHKYFSDLISVEHLVFFKEFSFYKKLFDKIEIGENVENDKTTNKKLLKHLLCNHDIAGIEWFFEKNLHIGLQNFNVYKYFLEQEANANVDTKIRIMNIFYENNMKISPSDIIYTIKNKNNPFILFKWYISKFGLSFEEDCFLVALKYGELDILKCILKKKRVFGFAQLKQSEERENHFSYTGIPTWEKHKHVCSFFSIQYGSYWKYNIEHVMEYLY